MRRAYKFRAYPTRPQEGRAERLLADHCDLYNAALQQTLRRLNVAFAAFFERIKHAETNHEKKVGFPRFKPYSRFDQVIFVAGDGAKWQPAAGGRWARSSFQAVGSVKVYQHRKVAGKVKVLQLKREHRRWYVIVIAEIEPVPLPAAGREVGVDVGVARFLTTSDGEVVANPRILAASAAVIADLERRKARAGAGSGNRKRIRRALAREWRKVRNRRRDFHHKTARALVDTCDVVALEDLNTAGMTKRPAPKPAPELPGAFLPNNATAKARLNKSILDAAWSQFTCILVGKAAEAGRRVVFVNPSGTSTTCHQCGRQCTRPSQDTVICPMHGVIDADINGALNIYARAGLGSGQATDAA